jgi:hypothetical protein
VVSESAEPAPALASPPLPLQLQACGGVAIMKARTLLPLALVGLALLATAGA